MNRPSPNLRKIATSLVALSVAATVAGCGRTLLFAENDGVNFKILANASSSPPVEANFGLNRTVATVAPGNKTSRNGEADGNAVNMLAAFDVDYAPTAQKALGGTLVIDNQFASGLAAKNIAETNPAAAVAITKIGVTQLTYSSSDSSKRLAAWLAPSGVASSVRMDQLQAWLDKQYPGKIPGEILENDAAGKNEAVRQAVISAFKIP